MRHAAAGREFLTLLQKTLPASQIAGLVELLPELLLDDRKQLREHYRATALDGPGRRLGVSLRAGALTAFVER